jgi:predicted nuclease with TOPRIM domain
MIADPAHYEDSQNVVAVNREYLALRERVAELTAEWDDLTAEAERIMREYHRAQEDLESERFGEFPRNSHS